jgi:ATP-dependent DNA helicase RecG
MGKLCPEGKQYENDSTGICAPGAAHRAALALGAGLPVGFWRGRRHLPAGRRAAAAVSAAGRGRRSGGHPDQLHFDLALGGADHAGLVPEAGSKGRGGVAVSARRVGGVHAGGADVGVSGIAGRTICRGIIVFPFVFIHRDYFLSKGLEVVFITVAHRLSGLFARILRCFPLQSVRIAAKNRLVFDELLVLQLGMQLMKSRSREKSGCVLKTQDMDSFYNALPFILTNSQQTAIEDCIRDMQKEQPMNRLVQGDVGSGKTAVAAGAAYFVYENGCQSALMAPTEILAEQHYETLKGFLEPLGVKVALLTGSMTAKQKKLVKEGLENGEYAVAVGTHALVQQTTKFKKLALVITDEQHRFGVEQRAALASKGENPHKLVMSATPIPRTLALMIYGDLDISVLKELPKGRQPVETYAVTGKLRERAFNYVKKYLDEGRQGYIVCPMIEESDMDLQDVKTYAKKLSQGTFKDYTVGLLHGRMSGAQKEQVMNDFKEHKIDLLVSTTVVEVGVDVPNAAIMVIENADRFGLSQLHQLRGRVGRGKYKSSCILITDNVNEDSVKRLKILGKTNDGFKISEEDLKLRGPGDFFGSRQHGLPALKIADMSQDMDILRKAQEAAQLIRNADPKLERTENIYLRELVDKLFDKTMSDN